MKIISKGTDNKLGEFIRTDDQIIWIKLDDLKNKGIIK